MTTGPDWRLFRYDTLPSTSDACIARAQAGEPEGLAVQARIQTRPRGSRGRSWSEAGGTLAVSVLLRPDATQPRATQPRATQPRATQPHATQPRATQPHARRPWPLLAALALHDALCLTPRHGEALRLKWPNDVMLDGRKLAGILIEASPAPDPSGWLVIGFGANLAAAPALAERQAACLAELGAVPCADDMADRLLASLRYWHGHRDGAARIRTAWLARAHPPGTTLAVGTADGQTTGSFSSIAEDGTLLLDVAGEIRRITAGEVHLPQGA